MNAEASRRFLVTATQMESLAIKQEKFHGEWNYTLQPRV